MAEERATIHLVPHFHYHPVGQEDQRTYTRRAFELVQEHLEACRRDPGYHLLLSELDYLQPFLAAHGEHRDFLRELVSDGRIETSGAYSQPNEMCLQGEAIIRNILYGRLYQEGLLGATPTVYLPLDVFGHCLQLPQIAAKSGFEAIIWSKDLVGAPPLCYALAPDGTALLQKQEPHPLLPESFEELLDTAANGLENQAQLGLRHDLHFLGGDMAPAPLWLAGRSHDLAARDPILLLSTPGQYLSRVKPEAQLRSAVIPVLGRDFYWYHMGALVTRAELKIANRLAENRLLSAEKWATLASLLGARYPDHALDKAWRQVLFGQHHDAVSGTSSDVSFLDLLAGYREALDLATGVEENALSYLTHRMDTAGAKRAPRDGFALVVFNSLSWSRTDVCRARVALDGPLASGFKLIDEGGHTAPCQLTARAAEDGTPWAEIAFVATDVPSLGYRTYYLEPASQLPPEGKRGDTDSPTIENEYLALRVDPAAGGGLTSIYLKSARKELLNPGAGPANELIALAEQFDREKAPWELFTTGEMVRSSASQADVAVLRGPVFSQLRITAQLPDRGDLIQELTLYQGLPRIDLRTTVANYRGEHELVVLTFPLAVPGGVPTFEDRFASVVRKPSSGRLDFRTLEERNLSHCGLASAQNWLDVGPAPSLAIMSGHRRIGAVPLGPCGIISSRDLKHRAAMRVIEKALLSRGITCTHWLDTDDPETDTPACAFRISLGCENAYSQKLLAGTPDAAIGLTEALADRTWAGVLLHRPDPESQWPDVPVLVADTADPRGVPYLAQLLAAEIEADNLQIPESCDFSGSSQPAEDCGLALINRGSLAASLENDGTLVGLLFHTSSWSTHPWGEGKLSRFFVPEHKSHVFEHSLLPHAGDWRRGGVVRAGYEANNPLLARQSPVKPGVLPTEMSLVSTDAPNVIITAVKPIGNPIADHRLNEPSDPSRGIVLRAYESEGRATDVRLRFAADPQEVSLTDLMERKIGEVTIDRPRWRRPAEASARIPPCGIATLVAHLAPLGKVAPPTELGPTAEPFKTTHCRYWEHNVGAAPMGNQPVTLWLSGELPIGKTTRFSLGVSNDARDSDTAGTIEVIAPAEWTLIPRQIPFRILAASQAVYEVMVVIPPDASPCFLRAIIRDGDKVIQDVLPIGEIEPLESSLTREDGRFSLRVKNPNPDYVEGQVALITPLESWGPSVDRFALSEVTPRLHVFRLDPGAEEIFPFAVDRNMEGLWAVAKIMWYGRVQYVQESPAD